MTKTYLLGFLVTIFIHSINAEAGSFIKPCKSYDKLCLVRSTEAAIPYFVKGIPEYGISPLDPFFIKSGSLDYPNLKITYTDVNIYGLSGLRVLDVERDLNASTIKWVGEMPMKMVGKYHTKGKFYFLDMDGNGDIEVTSEKNRFTLLLKMGSFYDANGIEHWNIVDSDYDIDILDDINVKLSDLFAIEGKARVLQDVFKNNFKELVNEVNKPIVSVMATTCIGHIDQFFRTVPASALELK